MALTVLYYVVAAIVAALFIYLGAALLKPEWFA
jgi:K+-transporting ATPase KdpF subunit